MIKINSYFNKTTSSSTLAVFRIALGTMLLWSIVRFWANGWIEAQYIIPKHFFPYYGFEFVTPFGQWTYLLFVLCGISALLVVLGLFYRMAIVSLFLSFTYIELMDKSTYLNHYYFVSLVCFLMCFLPAHTYFSLDAWRKPNLRAQEIPAWCVDSLKFLVCILYFCAGLAKINSDWLLHAMPLKLWLPARNDMPVIGFLFNYSWIHYAFSWVGCLYDLSIPFLLWNKRTRLFAYVAVVVFHLLTSLLFPIGVFPYVMIVTALVFFSPSFHQKVLDFFGKLFRCSANTMNASGVYKYPPLIQQSILTLFAVFFVWQLMLPFRYLLYPGELFWTEEGYRFSWRVMLMEKTGYTQFVLEDEATGRKTVVNNDLFLTDLQEKMMSTQPDMILQYAHILRDHYAQNGFQNPKVYVDSYVALNGRFGKPLVKPNVDLAKEKESFAHKYWIVPFDDEIQGF